MQAFMIMHRLIVVTSCLCLMTSIGFAQVNNVEERTKSEVLSQLNSITNRLNHAELDAALIEQQRQLLSNLRRVFKLPATTPKEIQSETPPQQSPDKDDSPPGGETTQPAQPPKVGNMTAPQNSETPDFRPLTKPKLTDAVWGHLPPQEQQELIRTFNETFVPEYEEQIRKYFENLSQ